MKPAGMKWTILGSMALLALCGSCVAQVSYDAPSREELEDVFRKIGRDPVTPELVDSAMLRFRQNWSRRVADSFQFALNPTFVTRVDNWYGDVFGKPATTLQILDRAIAYHVGYDDLVMKKFLRDGAAHAKATGKPTVTIRGKVLDEVTDQPLEGVLVYTGRGGSAQRTKADGTFSLEGLAPGLGAVLVVAESKGFGFGETVVAVDYEKGGTYEQNIRLVKAVAFEGRVVDVDGKPVGRAGIAAWIDRSLICRDGSHKNAEWAGNAVILGATSDADGRFAFEHMPPGATGFTVDVSHPRFQPQSLKGQNAPTTDEMPLVVTLVAGCEVSGRVVDEKGNVVRGAWVQLFSKGAGGFGHQTHTDVEGRFHLENLTSGEWDVVVEPEEQAIAIRRIDVSQEKPVRHLEIVVTTGEFISGVVLDPDNKPVADAAVGWLSPMRNGSPLPPVGHGINRMTSTNAIGAFRIGPVPPGEYSMTALVDPPRFIGKTTGKTGQKSVVFRLEPDKR